MVASAGAVAHGRFLPVAGTQNQVTATNANAGPNALLAANNYPLPTSGSSGPLTSAAATFTGGFWRINSTPGSGQNNLVSLWTSPNATYTLNNSPSNLGGIVQSAMSIDGYPVGAGTYVYQFMDLSAGGVGNFLLQSGGQPVLFRGCRLRAVATSPGFFNSETGGYNQFFAAHYCDFGGAGKASECDIALQVTQTGGLRLYRNYISWVGSGIIPSASNVTCDIIENLIEDTTLYNAGLHLNGIKWQGGDTNFLCLRNCVIVDKYDALGNNITQTDCIAMIPTFGAFAGQGVNSDGSVGYFMRDNFVGGSGNCIYLGSDNSNSPVANLTVTGNQWTAQQYSTGGAVGPTAHLPPNGFNAGGGNVQSNNVWADGPSAGQSVI